MFCFIYILIGVLTALGVGVYLYRERGAYDNGDYIPAIIAGLLWPAAAILFAMNKGLELFKRVCIKISDSIDAEKERLEKERLKREAAKSAAKTTEP